MKAKEGLEQQQKDEALLSFVAPSTPDVNRWGPIPLSPDSRKRRLDQMETVLNERAKKVRQDSARLDAEEEAEKKRRQLLKVRSQIQVEVLERNQAGRTVYGFKSVHQ